MFLNKTFAFFLAVISLLIFSAPLAWAKPPPWAPAHGYRAKHQYHYYPGQQVYYAPDRNKYYYQQQGFWRSAFSLPSWIRLGEKVILDMITPNPYEHHPAVYKQYPGKKK